MQTSITTTLYIINKSNFGAIYKLTVTITWREVGLGARGDIQESASINIAAFLIANRTYATDPNPRDRQVLGVGEQVELDVLPHGFENYLWREGIIGKINRRMNYIATYTAPNRTNTDIITMSVNNLVDCRLRFSIIQPEHILTVRISGIWHKQYKASIGYKLKFYNQPTNVSFYRIMTRETRCPGITTGYFDTHNVDHVPNDAWSPSDDYVEGRGTPMLYPDNPRSGILPPPYSLGTLTWNIPDYYRVDEGGSGLIYNYLPQVFTIFANGDMNLTKGDVNETARFTDLDSNY